MKAYCINLLSRPERWMEFKEQKLPFEVERFEAIKNTIGWVGCRDSYLSVLEKVKGLTFIMEDDCLFLESWSFIDDVMKQLPDDWDLLYLGATLNEPLKKYSENLYRITWGWTTHAILYNGDKVAKYILQNRNKINKIDVFMANYVQPNFNCFITYPLCATQRAGFSDIINGPQDYSVITERYKKYVL
jgi:hypothetical protein